MHQIAINRQGRTEQVADGSCVDHVADNVVPLFDQYVIADEQGRVLYDADGDNFRQRAIAGPSFEHRARLDFVNHVNVRELVEQSTQRQASDLGEDLSALGLETESQSDMHLRRFGIHSRVEDFSVSGVKFRAFVHPFQIDGLESVAQESNDSDGQVKSYSVLFMIGIVSTDSRPSI